MNETERYLFDLNGFIVIPGILTPAEVDALNVAIDDVGIPQLLDETDYIHTGFPEMEGNSDPDAGPVDKHHGLMLDWAPEFRSLVDDARILPYLETLVGPMVRLDHSYAIFMRTNAGATSPHHLHNGGTPFDPSQSYLVRDGKIFNGLIVVSYALSDSMPGDGGFCAIPGSHKSNFAMPPDIAAIVGDTPPVVQVPMRAGDAVIFSEAVTHGCIPWAAQHDRRALLFKYCPGFMQWEKQSPWADLTRPFWTEQQRRILTGPYSGGRPGVRAAPADA